jgi:hypothetical protein
MMSMKLNIEYVLSLLLNVANLTDFFLLKRFLIYFESK